MIFLLDENILSKANKALLVSSVVVAVLFVFIFFASSGNNIKRTSIVSAVSGETISLFELQDLSSYVKAVSSRELFRPLHFTKAKKVKQKTINDLLKDYNLVGVVAVGDREAILKNRRTRKTSFVSVGASIGELDVIAIETDKVRFQYKGEQKDLYIQ